MRRMIPVRACITAAKRDINGNAYVTGRHVTTGKRKRLAWDGAVSELENHTALATLLLGGRPGTFSSMDGGGYVFTLDPAHCADPDALED